MRSLPGRRSGSGDRAESVPDTIYANESGGDPDVIPNLTYEQFLDFHRKYYHPANSYIYLYGNMDMVERLNWMDEHYLSHFEKIDVEANISLQGSFCCTQGSCKALLDHRERAAGAQYLPDLQYDCRGRFKPGRIHCLSDSGLRALFLPGCALKAGTLDAGIGEDIYSDYDNGTRDSRISPSSLKMRMLPGKEEFFTRSSTRHWKSLLQRDWIKSVCRPA